MKISAISSVSNYPNVNQKRNINFNASLMTSQEALELMLITNAKVGNYNKFRDLLGNTLMSAQNMLSKITSNVKIILDRTIDDKIALYTDPPLYKVKRNLFGKLKKGKMFAMSTKYTPDIIPDLEESILQLARGYEAASTGHIVTINGQKVTAL